MNCPTCGAENEADARFCAECGSPLDSEPDQPLTENEDLTIVSAGQIPEQAPTVAGDQEDVVSVPGESTEADEAEIEMDDTSTAADLPPGNGRGSSNTQRYIIIAVVVLLFLCCCCCLLAAVIAVASDPDIIDQFTFRYGLAPNLLVFV